MVDSCPQVSFTHLSRDNMGSDILGTQSYPFSSEDYVNPIFSIKNTCRVFKNNPSGFTPFSTPLNTIPVSKLGSKPVFIPKNHPQHEHRFRTLTPTDRWRNDIPKPWIFDRILNHTPRAFTPSLIPKLKIKLHFGMIWLIPSLES